MSKTLNIAVIGATGLVGSKMIEVIEERHFPVRNIYPVASNKYSDRFINFRNQRIPIRVLSDINIADIDIALFAVSSGISKKYAEQFIKHGVYVIDNSSAFRMDTKVPLVVPEVNADAVKKDTFIIANPNCSTIQLVMVLNQILKVARFNKVFISTYQAVSGAGAAGLGIYSSQVDGNDHFGPFPKKIFGNVIPQIGEFDDTHYCGEEMKLVNETRKILEYPELAVYPTVVRVPVKNSHSESVTLEFDNEITRDEIVSALTKKPGIRVSDSYHTPIEVSGSDITRVGRIRIPEWDKKIAQMWIVADNLRKGAATNAIQIAEIIKSKFFE